MTAQTIEAAVERLMRYFQDMDEPGLRNAITAELAGAQPAEKCAHDWVQREKGQPWLECAKCGVDYATAFRLALDAQLVQPAPVPTCSTHPDAPHGFNRNGSHNNGRYTCDCEGWAPDTPIEQGDAKDAGTEQDFLHLGSGASCGVQIVWPKEKRVGRREDMSPDGVLIVGLDNDNDVYIEVSGHRHGEWQSACVEFCNGGCGGGQSSRTRAALINLMTAIEADNAELPHKAFPGAAILAKPGEPT